MPGVIDKLLVPGFGIGTAFGIPTTAAINSTSTYTVSAGVWLATGMVAGLNSILFCSDSTAGGAGTQTITLAAGTTPVTHWIPSDGTSARIANTTTSVNVTLLQIM